MDRTCAATRRRAGLNHLSQHLRHWRPARDNQASGPGYYTTSPSLRSKVYAALVKTFARRNTVHLHPCCAQHTSLRASDSLDKVQHQLSPLKLRIYTSYNTISPSYTPLPGVMTALTLRTSLILVGSLQVNHLWCTGGQRGAQPWVHTDGPRGHFHKNCNQQPTNKPINPNFQTNYATRTQTSLSTPPTCT